MTMQGLADSLAAVPAVERLGWVLVHSLWQFTVAAAAASAAASMLWRYGPRVRHGVLACGLALMAAAPLVTWSLVNIDPPAAGRGAVWGWLPDAVAAIAPGRVEEAKQQGHGAGVRATDRAASPGIVSSSPQPFQFGSLRERLRPWLGWCVAAWLFGAVACAVRPLVGWLAWRRLVGCGSAVPPEVARMVARACRRLGVSRGVRVLQSAVVHGPAMAGWLKPVILVPMGLVAALPPAQLETLIVHELAHVRRGDFLVNLLQVLVETLAFYHPAVWWLSARLRVEREHCCDDLVVAATGGRVDYGRALIAIEDLRRRQAAVVAVGAADGSLVARITRLVTGVDRAASPPPAFAGIMTAAGLAACVALAAAMPDVTRAEEQRAATAVAGGVKGEMKVPDGAAAASPDARGALPKDTNQIKELTPEQALKLAKEFPGVTVEFVHKSLGKYQLSDCLPLNGLKSLDAQTATALAAYAKQRLLLNGLTTLDADTAKALAAFKGVYLYLDGLTTLDADTIKAFAEFKGHSLSLDGLTTLDADTIKALAELKRLDLVLGGLTALDADTAKAIAEFKCSYLTLNGLTTLDAAAAKALAEFRGQSLGLGGLTTLDAAAAKALAEYKGISSLALHGLTTLDADTAKALAEYKGQQLSLHGLTTLDADTAKALAEYKGFLYLNGLTALDADTAKAIGQGKCDVYLQPRVLQAYMTQNPLSPDTALTHARLLKGVVPITVETPDSVAIVKALAEYKGQQLSLHGLTTLDAETVKSLGQFKGQVNLQPQVIQAYINQNPLSPDTALELAALTQGVVPITVETPDFVAIVKALAEYKGQQLCLQGLTTLDADTGKALAEFKGRQLILMGLTTLDADTVKALGQFKGQVNLQPKVLQSYMTQNPLSPDTALPLAAFTQGVLPITAFESRDSVAIAKALATRKGPLKLPNLKKISPQTLSALIEKNDVEIPLIETLELIPEPDGSANDDFVIPKDFQEREKRPRSDRPE